MARAASIGAGASGKAIIMTSRFLPCLGAALLLCAAPVLAAPPKRVVSMNVCTDQMAMLLAREGQLLSVTYLASDPNTSALAAQAGRYTVNHGLAEEIYMLRPDLVLAGTYTTRTTVGLLRDLGIPVEEFPPAGSFEDVRAQFRRMGDALETRDRAEAALSAFDAELARLAAQPVPDLRTALYFANSYSSGSGTLVDEVVGASGLRNVAHELGIRGTAVLPLEALIMADPDFIATGEQNYGAPALAQQTFLHPAFRALAAGKRHAVLPSALTVCGGPFTLEAIRLLQAAAMKESGP